MQNIELNYVVLPTEDYESECSAIFNGGPQFKSENHRREFFRNMVHLQLQLEKLLGSRWQEAEDWEVSKQCEGYYWLCGGVYSTRIFCVEYLQTVSSFLLSTELPDVWAYNTVCEISDGENYEDRGEFFQRGSDVFIDGELMKQEHRRLLGCPV